jgi:hypothetical protein
MISNRYPAVGSTSIVGGMVGTASIGQPVITLPSIIEMVTFCSVPPLSSNNVRVPNKILSSASVVNRCG